MTPPKIVTRNKSMLALLQLVDLAAKSPATILITGESGTGKELLAQRIHAGSPRRGQPFVAVHCGGIPYELLESELFGHVKGAFTDAKSAYAGEITRAHGGSLFLDEVGTMPLGSQVKLLRFLETRRFKPLGASQERTSDVRVIAAMNEDPHEVIKEGRLREDLFHRLNVMPFNIPPLRERLDDLRPLSEHFLKAFNGRDLTDSALRLLRRHTWPGNVRELRNMLERAVILANGSTIDADHLTSLSRLKEDPEPPPAHGHLYERLMEGEALYEIVAESQMSLKAVLEKIKKAAIVAALKRNSGHRTRAAHAMGMNRTTLVEYLNREKLNGHVTEDQWA